MSNLSDLFANHDTVVFFDTETTGLSAKSNRIIELAMIQLKKGESGGPFIAEQYDEFIRLPEGEVVPEKITEITHITNEMVLGGISEEQAVADFLRFVGVGMKGKSTLLIAHNAQFDICFVKEMLKRHGKDIVLSVMDYIDTLTVYKDRRAYPHRLANAIEAYGLEDRVQNSHRAIDDVLAQYEVAKALDDERADLSSYINVFGFNPKYGMEGERVPGVAYCAQYFNNYMQSENSTLPAKLRSGRISAV